MPEEKKMPPGSEGKTRAALARTTSASIVSPRVRKAPQDSTTPATEVLVLGASPSASGTMTSLLRNGNRVLEKPPEVDAVMLGSSSPSISRKFFFEDALFE